MLVCGLAAGEADLRATHGLARSVPPPLWIDEARPVAFFAAALAEKERVEALSRRPPPPVPRLLLIPWPPSPPKLWVWRPPLPPPPPCPHGRGRAAADGRHNWPSASYAGRAGLAAIAWPVAG
eukprot:NODE_25728_length_577_cov_1.166667.p2 GENE.NODE_25728_length_577_cov_1.166667~~NODE_25728_length_577_cov_1.166667.p2  ORF type:complete len:123 (+),score=28.45 NODE_25728_length_577_cov_1.166667:205-573(+)